MFLGHRGRVSGADRTPPDISDLRGMARSLRELFEIGARTMAEEVIGIRDESQFGSAVVSLEILAADREAQGASGTAADELTAELTASYWRAHDHRLASVRHADRICVLRDGRVVDQGGHADLLALGGQYAELYTCRPPSTACEPSQPLPLGLTEREQAEHDQPDRDQDEEPGAERRGGQRPQ